MSPGMMTSPNPSMVNSRPEVSLGAMSLIGASMDRATVTITGVAKTYQESNFSVKSRARRAYPEDIVDQ